MTRLSLRRPGTRRPGQEATVRPAAAPGLAAELSLRGSGRGRGHLDESLEAAWPPGPGPRETSRSPDSEEPRSCAAASPALPPGAGTMAALRVFEGRGPAALRRRVRVGHSVRHLKCWPGGGRWRGPITAAVPGPGRPGRCMAAAPAARGLSATDSEFQSRIGHESESRVTVSVARDSDSEAMAAPRQPLTHTECGPPAAGCGPP